MIIFFNLVLALGHNAKLFLERHMNGQSKLRKNVNVLSSMQKNLRLDFRRAI